MENNLTAFALSNSVRRPQRRYPANDPTLPQFSALVHHRNQAEVVAGFNRSFGWQNQFEFSFIVTENPNNQDDQVTGLHQSITIREDDDDDDDGAAEVEIRGEEEEREVEVERRRVGEEEIEVEGGGGVDRQVEVEGDLGDDPSNPGMNGQQTTRLTNPRVAPYALTMVLALLGLVIGIIKQGKHTLHIIKDLMLLFVVSVGIAYISSSIYSWVNDRSDYKMLKGLYYICYNVAFVSLLLILYTNA